MRLINGLSDERLLSRIKRFNRLNGLSQRALGFYLLDFDSRRLHLKYGFSSTAHFALMRLSISQKKTRDLLRISRALEDLPLIDEAFARGKIFWSAVRELTRVATRETEKEWLELAMSSSLRAIERAVAQARYGDRPPRDPYGLTRTAFQVKAELCAEDYAVWETAFDRLRDSSGSELDTSKALLLLAQSFLERPLDKKEKKTRKAFQVVYHRCGDCHRAWLQTDDGPEGISSSRVAEREKDAVILDLDEEERSTRDGPRGASSPADVLVPKEERDGPNTAMIRQQVLGRDGHRCAVPGCENKGNLYAHHVRWKSHGGKTEIINEVSLCGTCHGLVHDGLLRLEGDAPHGLIWSGKDGAPLLASVDPVFLDQPLFTIEGFHEKTPRGPAELERTILSLDDIPAVVTAEWWQIHQHNFILNGKRLMMKNVG